MDLVKGWIFAFIYAFAFESSGWATCGWGSLTMRCGYPASSIRERIYAGGEAARFGVLLYTGSPDAEGTLGGLVREARLLQDHLADALRIGAFCSNDPICAHHAPGQSMEERWLHGAACHGCSLVAETSCEMRKDYLDRALVVPVLGVPGAAFFQAIP
jgi:MrfA Zn-binding domain